MNPKSSRFCADRNLKFNRATTNLTVFDVLLAAARDIDKSRKSFSAERAADFSGFFHVALCITYLVDSGSCDVIFHNGVYRRT
jgi:hypothetical protein